MNRSALLLSLLAVPVLHASASAELTIVTDSAEDVQREVRIAQLNRQCTTCAWYMAEHFSFPESCSRSTDAAYYLRCVTSCIDAENLEIIDLLRPIGPACLRHLDSLEPPAPSTEEVSDDRDEDEILVAGPISEEVSEEYTSEDPDTEAED